MIERMKPITFESQTYLRSVGGTHMEQRQVAGIRREDLAAAVGARTRKMGGPRRPAVVWPRRPGRLRLPGARLPSGRRGTPWHARRALCR